MGLVLGVVNCWSDYICLQAGIGYPLIQSNKLSGMSDLKNVSMEEKFQLVLLDSCQTFVPSGYEESNFWEPMVV